MIPTGGGSGPTVSGGFGAVQTTRPRDVGALALVVGLFLILLLVTIAIGPAPH